MLDSCNQNSNSSVNPACLLDPLLVENFRYAARCRRQAERVTSAVSVPPSPLLAVHSPLQALFVSLLAYPSLILSVSLVALTALDPLPQHFLFTT